MTRDDLVADARKGDLLATVTARLGPNSDVDHPQPALWLPRNPLSPGQTKLQKIPELIDDPSLDLFGRHVVEGAIVLIDGRKVDADVLCQTGGALPACTEERLRIELADFPPIGNHNLQVATPGGLLSNEVLLISHTCGELATFSAIDCRLGTLLEAVETATDLGPLQPSLLRQIVSAVEAVDLAEELAVEENERGVRRRLQNAATRLRSFIRRVDSSQGRRIIPEATRMMLLEQASDIRDDVLTLRG
jgi:hypothetical protein